MNKLDVNSVYNSASKGLKITVGTAVLAFSASAANAVENTEQTGNEQEKSLEQIMSDAGALSFSGKTEVSQLPKVEHDFESDFKNHEDAISLLDQ